MYLNTGLFEKGVINGELGYERKSDDWVKSKNIGGTLYFDCKEDKLLDGILRRFHIGSKKRLKLVDCIIVDSEFVKKPRIYKKAPKKDLKYRVIRFCQIENCKFDCDVVLFNCKIVKDGILIEGK
jgi:hypothetical protein